MSDTLDTASVAGLAAAGVLTAVLLLKPKKKKGRKMKRFTWKRMRAKGSCAKGSIRTKRLAKGKVLRICCPKKKWSPKSKRCRGGTVGYELGTPKAKRRQG